LENRQIHQDSLDLAVEAWTLVQVAARRVPAGMCQNAENRVDTDPQLKHLNWLTEVTGTKIGTWPIYELPMKFSRTPAYIGGPTNHGAPCYGEDNVWVLTELLGRTPSEVERLAEEGVI
jgi:crotonobetainyl-CoA:carnitine CoA-transferase CaiB-like acyl-CoA transferase